MQQYIHRLVFIFLPSSHPSSFLTLVSHYPSHLPSMFSPFFIFHPHNTLLSFPRFFLLPFPISLLPLLTPFLIFPYSFLPSLLHQFTSLVSIFPDFPSLSFLSFLIFLDTSTDFLLSILLYSVLYPLPPCLTSSISIPPCLHPFYLPLNPVFSSSSYSLLIQQ